MPRSSARPRRVAAAAAARPGTTIAVSNEVGIGVVPVSALGRRYRDVLGRVNASWADAADGRSSLSPAGRCGLTAPSEAAAGARAALDAKTKPRGRLGRLEDLAVRIAEIRGTSTPGRLRAAVVVAAADHGVAAQGVSAYPQEVTAQMLANFASGGAAVCVLSRVAGAELRVFDLGVGAGTADMTAGPAMSARGGRATRLEQLGREPAPPSSRRTGSASSRSARWGSGTRPPRPRSRRRCSASIRRRSAARGTGLDDAGARAQGRRSSDGRSRQGARRRRPARVLAAVGGFEIAFLAGVVLGAADHRLVVLLDGFITGAAALVAAEIDPRARAL